MLEQLGDSASVALPVALTLASVVFAETLRFRRRRRRLNTALHELRRPLHALTLAETRAHPSARGQLEVALDALDGLDRVVNGGRRETELRLVDARSLADDAIVRWRLIASRSGRRLEFVWSANGSRLICEPAAVGRALDNLIANSLEHGTGPVRLEATVRARRLRLRVADGADARADAGVGDEPRRRGSIRPRRSNSRRGHGLRVVADVAARHGGRFAACRHDTGASAVLELPLAE